MASCVMVANLTSVAHIVVFISQMITFTSYGCTDSKVTTIPNRHAITDKQLHDIVVRVDTTTPQPIDSTCRFQYVLNML
ncbi:StfH/YfcO family fimbrial adhesin [Escherichia sp. E2748]|uniref:StfH/YfcO family fimbrial adhesin n=1 Tax=unclassified Escherichia TaxID=2608889 RepID=UPI003211DE1A